jgi:hypothetical protein
MATQYDPNQLAKMQKAGQYAQAGGSSLALFGDWYNDTHKYDNYNINGPSSETDAYGRPVYNLQGLEQKIGAIDTSGPTLGSIGKSAGQGAAAGSAFGPYGAAIGGIVGATGGLISGLVGSKKAQEKKRQAQMNLLNAQRMYNAQMVGYNNQLAGQSLYGDIMNNDRSFNLAKFNSPLT